MSRKTTPYAKTFMPYPVHYPVHFRLDFGRGNEQK
jgi:hypothetical protein